MSAPSLRARWKLLLGLAVLYSLAHFAYSAIYFPLQTEGADFRSVFPGKLLFRIAETWPWFAKDWIAHSAFTPSSVGWNYGPVVQFLTVPFVFVPTKPVALTIILLLDLGLVVMSFLLWVRLLFGARPRGWVVAGLACLWMNYFPLLEAIAGREVELLELWLITVAVWALRARREGLAGVAIGVAAMTKFLPVVFIPYLLITRFRRAFWAAVAAVLLIVGPAQWWLGFQHSVTFSLLAKEASGEMLPSSYPNIAISNVLYKMFTPFTTQEPPPAPLYPDVLRPIGIVLHAVVVMACGWFLLQHRRSSLLEVETALLALVMVLAAPHAKTYYLVFALPALSIGLAAWIRHRHFLSPLLKIAWVLAVVLSGFLVPTQVLGVVLGLPRHLTAIVLQRYSLPAFGAMLAAIVMVGIHQASRTSGLPAPSERGRLMRVGEPVSLS
jgi:hypothetical protein